MVALPAKRGPVWGVVLTGSVSSVRAYDDVGNCFSFVTAACDEWRFALDVERRRPDDCGFVSSALGSGGLSLWVEVEVLAKLANQPAHLALRQVLAGKRAMLSDDVGVEISRMDTASHWIAVGRRRWSADVSLGV